jgi:hypothetical protein
MSIQEQYLAAGKMKQGLKDGTYGADDGGPAPSSADIALIATCREALSLLETRPAPNGIGYTATCSSEVARIIRGAAKWDSCTYCGAIYTSGEFGPTCECPEHERSEEAQ